MSPLPYARSEVPTDRRSDAPIAIDSSGPHPTGSIDMNALGLGWLNRIPPAWIGMSGYLVAGVFLGLVLIVALSLTRGDRLPPAAAGVITDNTVHLHGKDVGDSCWRGMTKKGGAQMTVSMEIGLDGKVRSAVAAGAESPTMKSCVEAHVKGWQFLPQATPSTMVLPFEIDAR